MNKIISAGILLSMAFAAPLSAQPLFGESAPTPVLICRAHQCAAASFSMGTGFLFNKMAELFENNLEKTIRFCEADAVSRVCKHEGLSIPAQSALVWTQIVMPSATLLDAQLAGPKGLVLKLDYKVRANRTHPRCDVATATLTVAAIDRATLKTEDFNCMMTATGTTSMNLTFTIDYVDFDYGTIGAHYTLGVAGSVMGDQRGYALMRFTERAPVAESDYDRLFAAPPPPMMAFRPTPLGQALPMLTPPQPYTPATAQGGVSPSGSTFMIKCDMGRCGYHYPEE